MAEQFYDKVAKKFGTLEDIPQPLAQYPHGNPEATFEQRLLELSGKDKIALDLGCGDGGFTLRIAEHFQEIVGIDSAVERLKLARVRQQEAGNSNVRFEEYDAYQSSFADNSFDLVYSRRGPTPYQECYRVLKSGGHFASINIGERDAWDLKQIFGRGQGYRVWNTPAVEQARKLIMQAGFQVVSEENILYDEYYASFHDLHLFLQTVPIFEDFDTEQDKRLLEEYVKKAQTEQGIHLPRHRYVIVAVKG